MKESPVILSVETATLAGSISLSRGRGMLNVVTGDNQISHSNTLLLDIKNLLTATGLALHDIDLFAVASGPGSFTGLRIGIATVKALAFTTGKPCIGVPTLEAVAHSAGTCERVIAVLPAGRGEVFVQMFSVSADEVIALDSATHITPEAMLQKYSVFTAICWCGDGAHIHREKIKDCAKRHNSQLLQTNVSAEMTGVWKLMPQTTTLAEHVAVLAAARAEDQELLTPEALTALYVRLSDAELKSKPVD